MNPDLLQSGSAFLITYSGDFTGTGLSPRALSFCVIALEAISATAAKRGCLMMFKSMHFNPTAFTQSKNFLNHVFDYNLKKKKKKKVLRFWHY